jgi:uncharacterized protein YbjT (DUF2867 family)
MIILVTGASGFIGQRLVTALRAAGHDVREALRGAHAGTNVVHADYTRDLDETNWLSRLVGIDAVINAVGILRERGPQTFERVHTLAPRALFAACVAAGVTRVIQISALGADTGKSGYFVSKRRADEYLASLPLEWTIVQPSIVFGIGGTSARLFMMLASLPWIPLVGRGQQLVQPIHIDDLTAVIVAAIGRADCSRQRIALVGPEPLTMRDCLSRLRHSLGLRPTRFLPVPVSLMRAGARIAGMSSRSLLDPQTLTMLQAGNTASPTITETLLQRRPRDVTQFISATERDIVLHEARLSWLLHVLRLSIAAVWIWTGIVSLGLYPREASYELLARTGITGPMATVALYAGALLDLALGAATLLLRRRRVLWLVQMLVILGYTAILTIRLPEFWLHPYGPVLKNLPMLACLALLYWLESPRWNTRS